MLRTINVDRATDPKLSDCDGIISMVELMSGGQRDRVKELAKRAGKKFIPLLRKEDDHWQNAFGPPGSQKPTPTAPASKGAVALKVVPPAPPSQPPVSVQETSSEMPFVDTRDDIVTRELSARITELEELHVMYDEENARLVGQIEALQATRTSENASWQTLNASWERSKEENATLAKQNAEQEKLITQLRSKTSVKQVNDLGKAIESFKVLKRMGLASDSDIVEKLFSYKDNS